MRESNKCHSWDNAMEFCLSNLTYLTGLRNKAEDEGKTFSVTEVFDENNREYDATRRNINFIYFHSGNGDPTCVSDKAAVETCRRDFEQFIIIYSPAGKGDQIVEKLNEPHPTEPLYRSSTATQPFKRPKPATQN